LYPTAPNRGTYLMNEKIGVSVHPGFVKDVAATVGTAAVR
jgi:hypothetical protein